MRKVTLMDKVVSLRKGGIPLGKARRRRDTKHRKDINMEASFRIP